MKQTTFASLAFDRKKKQTRRERFLAEMEVVVPWAGLLAVIEPHYPRAGQRGRRPMPLSTMLRIYFMQQWYALSDPAMEDALYEIESMRRFAGLELADEAMPDETTILKFRHLLEKHGLSARMMNVINDTLEQRGLLLKGGTMVDATIIHAAPSTKNQDKQRDPEMHQTKKGNQWCFGMKAHIGMDAQSGLVYTVVGMAANVAGITQTEHLLHGEEQAVFLGAGYTAAKKREEFKELKVLWHIAKKRSQLKTPPEQSLCRALLQQVEKLKASIRAHIEHAFHVVKNLFHYKKVRYKGLVKNATQLRVLFGLTNLVIAKRRLMALDGPGYLDRMRFQRTIDHRFPKNFPSYNSELFF